MLIPARLDQNLARALAEKDFPVAAVPVGDAALRPGGAIVECIRDRGESFAARGFQEAANIRSREVAQFVEAEGNVLHHETVIALAARDLELVARDLFHGCSLNLRERQG